MRSLCFLVLFATQVFHVSSAPTSLTTVFPPEDLDFSNTYLKFFKIKELIEKINIKKFREFQESQEQGIEAPVESEPSVTTEDEGSEDNLLEIDLTEEAIINDEVSVKLPELDTYHAGNEETTTALTEAVSLSPLGPVVYVASTIAAAVDDITEGVTVAPTADPTVAPTADPTVVPIVTTVQADTQKDIPDISEEDALLNEIDTGADKFFISKESVESAKKYGYKILLKKINGKEVPVGKIKFSFPTLVEINTVEEEDSEEMSAEATTNDVVKEEEELPVVTTTSTAVPVPTVYVATEETSIEETTTANIEILEETTTALAVAVQPPPLVAVIPTVDVLDEYAITEGVKQITEDTEVAIEEIKNQNTTDTIVFSECTAQVADVEDMLMNLAKIISEQTPLISEILLLGKSFKDETNPEILSRNGAKLLKLLEPFLESLVPAELDGCAGGSSNAMLISLSGMASQLDTIANNEVNQDKASSLHQSATSLQLAAWVMAQLQSSVHTFYSQEGICGDKDSSTADILGSLSKAITGYIPVVTMLGNQEAVEELKETIEALERAETDIEELETRSGTRLPGVECGASFSQMAEALENLADFIEALDSNKV